MCTNDRLIYRLECYMDNLVDCFEDFVQKSMLVISVAVGTLVLMVMYVIKLMSEPAALRQITITTDDTECTDRSSKARFLSLSESTPNVHTAYENSEALLVNYVPSIDGLCKRMISSHVISTHSSFDDNFMQEVELCVISKPCESSKQTQVSEDLKSARTESNYWLPKRSCLSKSDRMDLLLNDLITLKKSVEGGVYPDHQSTARQCNKRLATRSSCCSICCQEDNPNE